MLLFTGFKLQFYRVFEVLQTLDLASVIGHENTVWQILTFLDILKFRNWEIFWILDRWFKQNLFINFDYYTIFLLTKIQNVLKKSTIYHTVEKQKIIQKWHFEKFQKILSKFPHFLNEQDFQFFNYLCTVKLESLSFITSLRYEVSSYLFLQPP